MKHTQQGFVIVVLLLPVAIFAFIAMIGVSAAKLQSEEISAVSYVTLSRQANMSCRGQRYLAKLVQNGPIKVSDEFGVVQQLKQFADEQAKTNQRNAILQQQSDLCA